MRNKIHNKDVSNNNNNNKKNENLFPSQLIRVVYKSLYRLTDLRTRYLNIPVVYRQVNYHAITGCDGARGFEVFYTRVHCTTVMNIYYILILFNR